MGIYLIGELKEIRKGKGFSRKRLANRISHLCKKDFKKRLCLQRLYKGQKRGSLLKKKRQVI